MTVRSLYDAVVIGGGVTGLMVAHNLRRSELQPKVLLVEPEKYGGVISTASLDGFLVEQGPNILLSKPELMKVIGELELEASVVRPAQEKYRQFVWQRGRMVEVPKSFRKFLMSPLFPIGDKLRLLGRLCRRGVMTPAGSDESVATFFTRLIGETAVQGLLDPALKGIYGGHVSRLSARSLFPGVWQAAQSGSSFLGYMIQKKRSQGTKPKAFVIRGGLRELARGLVEGMEEEVSFAADSVTTVSEQASGGFSVTLAKGQAVDAAAVFVCTPAYASARILQTLDPAVSRIFQSVRYSALVFVHGVTRDLAKIPKGSFGVLFGDNGPAGAYGIMFNSEMFPHVSPEGQGLLTVCLRVSDSGMPFEDAGRAVKEVLGISDFAPISSKIWPQAIPQLEVGHYSFVESVREFEAKCPGVYCVGSELGGVGIADRAEVAREVVARWHNDHRARTTRSMQAA